MRSSLQDARRGCPAVMLMLALIFMPISVYPVQAGTFVNIPGVSCVAYNNDMADKLERSHVRLFNPTTSPAGIWVVCGIPRVAQYVQSTTTKQSGYVNIYFDSTLPAGTAVSCGIREYDWSAKDTPSGSSTPAFINGITVTAEKNFAVGTSDVIDSTFFFVKDDITDLNFWTITCDLKPGTGINSIDWDMQ